MFMDLNPAKFRITACCCCYHHHSFFFFFTYVLLGKGVKFFEHNIEDLHRRHVFSCWSQGAFNTEFVGGMYDAWQYQVPRSLLQWFICTIRPQATYRFYATAVLFHISQQKTEQRLYIFWTCNHTLFQDPNLFTDTWIKVLCLRPRPCTYITYWKTS